MKKEDQIEIYVVKDSETDNMYLRMRGDRNDIYVKYNNKYYEMYAIEFTAFKNRLYYTHQSSQIYLYLTHLLIVKKLNKRYIIATILEQAKYHYFDILKESKVENGEILYFLSEESKKVNIKYNFPISCPISKLIRIY